MKSFEYRPHGSTAAPVDPDRCKASVHDRGLQSMAYQCSRKPWRDGWCKQHHPDSVAKREAESLERYERRWKNTPLARAGRRITELEAQNTTLVDALRVQYSKFGIVPDTLDELARQLETGFLLENAMGWAIVLRSIAEIQRDALAAMEG